MKIAGNNECSFAKPMCLDDCEVWKSDFLYCTSTFTRVLPHLLKLCIVLSWGDGIGLLLYNTWLLL